MAMSTDYVAIVSSPNPDILPGGGRLYGKNSLYICVSKWGLWEKLDEEREECELNDNDWPDESEMWILGFKMTWDYDEVLDVIAHNEGDLSDEEDIESWKEQYGDDEVMSFAHDRINDDTVWYGDPSYQAVCLEEKGDDWFKFIAAEVYTSVARDSYAREGVEISDIVLLPYIEWEMSLYGGRTRIA